MCMWNDDITKLKKLGSFRSEFRFLEKHSLYLQVSYIFAFNYETTPVCEEILGRIIVT